MTADFDPWPLFLAAVMVCFLAIEAYQGFRHRPTLSVKVRQWSQGFVELAYILVFSVGMLSGHFFWCWCGLRSPI
jgi:hypothetical protein